MGLKVRDILNLSVRGHEQYGKPSISMAGQFLVLNSTFSCKFVHNLVGQLH